MLEEKGVFIPNNEFQRNLRILFAPLFLFNHEHTHLYINDLFKTYDTVI
jgi:hypothetical protein